MIERAGSKLAGTTFHLFLQMHGLGIEGVGPANVRGPEEGDDRPLERRRKMPGAAVRGHD
jgi:hypothetical protein